ncbi:hypothetical protein GY45DRAFT_451714 [Cubamyces sp. BRFM 1775]|nr:hypothetical protein GY45DRAFT_451714 [Cubamyces sp. BRFM 1775]
MAFCVDSEDSSCQHSSIRPRFTSRETHASVCLTERETSPFHGITKRHAQSNFSHSHITYSGLRDMRTWMPLPHNFGPADARRASREAEHVEMSSGSPAATQPGIVAVLWVRPKQEIRSPAAVRSLMLIRKGTSRGEQRPVDRDVYMHAAPSRTRSGPQEVLKRVL